MSPDDFRKLVLRLPEVVEQQHQEHPDFRIGKKVFATLGWPDSAWAMIKLPLEEQQKYTAAQPSVFEPVPGAWGTARKHQNQTRYSRSECGRAGVTNRLAPRRSETPRCEVSVRLG
jgi:hypothetical protein